MLKKLIFSLSLFLAISFSYAQKKNIVTFYVNTGFSIPGSIAGDFSEYLKSSMNFGFGAGIPVSRKFTFYADVSYNRFHHDEKGIYNNEEVSGDPVVEVSGGSAGITTFSANLALKVNSRVPEGEFYISGGLGLMKLSIKDIFLNNTIAGGLTETAPAVIAGGLGFYDLSDDIKVFVSGKFIVGFTKQKISYFIPLSIGITFRFL